MARHPYSRSAFAKSVQATNAAATATQAPAANDSVYVGGIVVTYSGVVAVATTVTLGDGTTTLTFEIPASVAAAPNVPLIVTFPEPWKAATGATVTLTANAGGAAIVGSVVLHGYLAP